MIIRLFFVASLGAIAFVFGMLGLWVADRDIPVVGIQSMVVNSDVGPGQIIRVKVNAYRIRSCRTLVERFIEDSTTTRFSFPDIDYINPGPPGHIETFIELLIPQRVNNGVAIIKTNASWECNPVHRIWPIMDRQPDIAVLITGAK
jgi:hypothetical protein